MALLYDKFYMEDFGECKGIGRCGTCHIHILNDAGELVNKENASNENFNTRQNGLRAMEQSVGVPNNH